MNLLITAAGTGTAFSYATAIAKNFPEITLFTADSNPGELVTSSLFSEKHYQTKSSSDEGFFDEIVSIINSNSIDYYIPLVDVEIVGAYGNRSLRNKIASNNFDFCVGCVEKSNYELFFEVEGLSFPEIIFRDNISFGEKYIAKKNGGFGSRETKLVNCFEASEIENSFTLYEFIDGVEYTIDSFPLRGKVETSVRVRCEVKSGVCTKAKIVRNKELENIAYLLCCKFKLMHPFCFQVIEREGLYYLIDVNPRLGAGSLMSSINGMDFFSAHLALLLGRKPSEYLNRYHEGCIVTRQYSNYLTRVL